MFVLERLGVGSVHALISGLKEQRKLVCNSNVVAIEAAAEAEAKAKSKDADASL